ncbi:MAG: proton-conducting membrane transporter [Halobacteriaceae archaeon]
MPTRPELADQPNFVNGLAAVALFVVFAAVFLSASFADPAGFGEGVSVTASLGYALFNIGGDAVKTAVVESEGLLAAFEIVDVVLVAALVAAVMLARRETGGSVVTAITDGGKEGGEE